jgi:glycosyltransferase involved in cell wall biosynthesis
VKSARRISSLSIVFPAYNDYATIASMVLTALRAGKQYTDDIEVIVTNDGSQDATGLVLEDLMQRVPELHVAVHEHNRGYGSALRSGFSLASKEWIFYTDGDAQYDPQELTRLVDALEPGIDIVNGYKISRGDGWFRFVIGRVYHHFVKWLFRLKIKDVDCDFRLFRREILDRVSLISVNGAICVEMVKKFQLAGYTFAEVPVHHYARPFGVSQFFRPRNFWISAQGLIRLYQELMLKS